jgi:hypothetical protein
VVTPYERLLAEELPTGTFGRALPPREGPREWTALEQAEHLAVLETALDGWHWDRPARADVRRRHLRLVDGGTAETPAA